MAIVLKPRTTAGEITVLQSLQSRLQTRQHGRNRQSNLEKGLEGEQRFDKLMEELSSEVYLLNDLCLEHQSSVFQIDTLLISEKGILLFEVKNFEGDYVFDSGAFYTSPSRQEILNPLHQLTRCLTLLRSLLNRWNIQLPVKGYIAFVNPQFTLYQAPVDLPIILPTQLKRFIGRVDQTGSIVDKQHKQLAERFLESHLKESPYVRLPQYHFEDLRKGVVCGGCRMFMAEKDTHKVFCRNCGLEESIDSSILRSVEELSILFPNQQITTKIVHQWCHVIKSHKTIRRVLCTHFTPAGNRSQRYYLPKN